MGVAGGGPYGYLVQQQTQTWRRSSRSKVPSSWSRALQPCLGLLLHQNLSGPLPATLPSHLVPGYPRGKNTILISALTSNCRAGKFCDDMTCVLPSISQSNLYQIQLLRGVSESSGPTESKTVIEIQFWARFHEEKRENVRD